MDMADVLIHVHPDLSAEERDKPEEDLRCYAGIMSFHFSPEHFHLLTVVYDSDVTGSGAILAHVGERSVRATRIGL